MCTCSCCWSRRDGGAPSGIPPLSLQVRSFIASQFPRSRSREGNCNLALSNMVNQCHLCHYHLRTVHVKIAKTPAIGISFESEAIQRQRGLEKALGLCDETGLGKEL